MADALDLLSEELKNDEKQQRIDAVSRLRVVGLALGPDRVRRDLLPLLSTAVREQDDEVLMALGEALGGCVDVVGGSDYAHLLLPLLEVLAEVEETVVREKAVASLCKIGAQMPAAPFAENFIPLLKRLAASESFSSRISACGLFATAYPTSTSVVKGALRKLFTQLATDEMPMVRSAAFAHLPVFALQVDKPLLKSELLPLFQRLAQDEQEAVRCIAVENLVKMSKFLTAEENSQAFMQIIHGFAEDKCARVRQDRATYFCDLADALGADTAQRELLPVFVRLLQDPETDVRSAAATCIARFCAMLEAPVIISEIIPLARTLVTDSQQAVRAALSASLGDVSTRLGKEASVQHIIPLLNDMLRDDASEVRMNVISHLDGVHATVGSDVLSDTMLPHMVELSKDKQWRVRLAVVDSLPMMAQSIGAPAFENRLKQVLLLTLSDQVAAVREACANSLVKLVTVLGEAWVLQHCMPTVRDMGQAKNSYLLRITALDCCKGLAGNVSQTMVSEHLAPVCTALGKDPVANVRFCVGKALCVVVTKCDASLLESKIKPLLVEMQRDDDIDVKHFATVALGLAK